MGLVLIGLLAGVLIGLGLVDASHGYFLDCRWQGCADRFAVNQPLEPEPTALRQDVEVHKKKIATAMQSGERSPARPHRSIVRVKEAQHRPTKSNAPQADHRLAEMSDPILAKARAAVAAKLEDPSAEFANMDRAFRKNTFGRAVDTICGHVKVKNTSDEDTGLRSFLYLVKEDEAYVVDGKPDSAAATAYRNICD